MKRQFMLRLLLLRFLLLTLFLLTFNCSISNAAEKIITLDESKLYVAPDNQVQHFVQSIGLAKGQEKLDLTLTYYNGTETSPGFKWLRINSSSMSYLTEQQFGGKKELSVNVSGELAAGNNQMIIQAGGVKDVDQSYNPAARWLRNYYRTEFFYRFIYGRCDNQRSAADLCRSKSH
jgi:hypothetical protein